MTRTNSPPCERPESDEVVCKTTAAQATRLVAWVSAACALVWSGLLILPGLPLSLVKIVLMVNVLHLIGQSIASAVSLRLGARFAAAAVMAQVAMTSAMLLLPTPESVLEYCPLMTPAFIVSACAWIANDRHSASRQLPNGG
jgi:hypothetical protein